jgi:hypothetical protein
LLAFHVLCAHVSAQGLSALAEQIILASMSALLSPVQDDKIWRVKIVWPNRAVHHFGKFTSEQDAIDWINAHPRLTRGKADAVQQTLLIT